MLHPRGGEFATLFIAGYLTNVFAVLGLNSLFFALRGPMGMFRFTQRGVSFILFFVGAKMIARAWPPAADWFKQHNFVSVFFIATVLALSIVFAIRHSRLKPGEHEQP